MFPHLRQKNGTPPVKQYPLLLNKWGAIYDRLVCFVLPAPYLSKKVGSAQYMISSTLLVLWPPLHWV